MIDKTPMKAMVQGTYGSPDVTNQFRMLTRVPAAT
jgi:hypothetical protein